jgi:hypothetical protein
VVAPDRRPNLGDDGAGVVVPKIGSEVDVASVPDPGVVARLF